MHSTQKFVCRQHDMNSAHDAGSRRSCDEDGEAEGDGGEGEARVVDSVAAFWRAGMDR